MASFDIVVQTGASLHPDGEPSDYVSGYTGVVVCTDDATGRRAKVGKVTALQVHAALASDAGVSLFDVCDCHSHELHYLHGLLYEPGGDGFKEAIDRRFDAIQSDLLVLDYVVLAPKWRKLRVGLLAVKKFVDLIGGGCGLAVSLIAPLRHDAHEMLGVPGSWLPEHTGKAERRAAVTLRGYFRRMGFGRLGRTPYYALSMAQITPTAEELLGRESPHD